MPSNSATCGPTRDRWSWAAPTTTLALPWPGYDPGIEMTCRRSCGSRCCSQPGSAPLPTQRSGGVLLDLRNKEQRHTRLGRQHLDVLAPARSLLFVAIKGPRLGRADDSALITRAARS